MADVKKQEFRLVLSTVDQASAGLRALRSQLESIENPLKSINAGFEKTHGSIRSLQSANIAMSRALDQAMPWINTRMALPTLALGGFALKQSADFEEAWNRVKVLAGHAENYNETARTAMAETQKMARDIAKPLPYGPKEVLDAFGVILGMDPNMEKAKLQIRPVLNLALSDNIAPDIAAKLMQTFQAAFRGIGDIQASNMMAKLVASSSVRLTDLQDTFKNLAGSTITKKNVVAEDMLAATGVLSRSALVGPEAGTKLAVFLRELSMASIDENKQKALKRMNIRRSDIFEQVGDTEYLRDMEHLLNLFEKHKNNPLLANVIEKDNLTAVQFLLSRLDDFRALKKEMIEQKAKTLETGSAFLQAKVQTEGLKGSVRQLKGSLEELTLQMSDAGLLKAATGLVQGLQSVVDLMGKSDPIVMQLAMTVGALTLALAALGNTAQGLAALQAFLPGGLAAMRARMAGIQTAAVSGAAMAGVGEGAAMGAGAGAGAAAGIGMGPLLLGAAGVGLATFGMKSWADSEAQKWGAGQQGQRTRISDMVDQKKREASAERKRLDDLALGRLMAPGVARKTADDMALRNLAAQLEAARARQRDEAGAPGTSPGSTLGKITIDINGLPQGSKVNVDPTGRMKFDLNLGMIMQ
ncbi:MAG TPA: hypothetical protein VE954_06625 [Oligoflexus sp.]|uniref:hypothetical protein n=1 Tax=Oligoflexus sp. TaxID=1971216 RepID=UPI002D4FE97C|nr:hypothetical protein [Oligoflexus sp.]HYX32771.1 hypothetical protein [Oligoflexus sp.]